MCLPNYSTLHSSDIMYNDIIEWTDNSQVLNNPEAIAL